MKKLLGLLILSGMTQACEASYNIDQVQVDNILSQCLVVNKILLVQKNNVLFLHASLDIKDTIGACGCKSAAISYDVYESKKKILLSHGVFSSINKKEFYFVINSDASIYKKSNYELVLNCSS